MRAPAARWPSTSTSVTPGAHAAGGQSAGGRQLLRAGRRQPPRPHRDVAHRPPAVRPRPDLRPLTRTATAGAARAAGRRAHHAAGRRGQRHQPALRRTTAACSPGPTPSRPRSSARRSSPPRSEDRAYWSRSAQTTSTVADQLGLPNPFNRTGFPQPDQRRASAWPTVRGINARNDITRIYNADQNFTKMHGRHEFQFGGRFRHETLDVAAGPAVSAGRRTAFGSLATALYDPTSGNDLRRRCRAPGTTPPTCSSASPAATQRSSSAGGTSMRAREYAALFPGQLQGERAADPEPRRALGVLSVHPRARTTC